MSAPASKINIGGEYFYSPLILFKKKQFELNSFLESRFNGKNYYYTFGGHFSLLKILDEISFDSNQHVLMPSYLCSSMLSPFKKRNIKYHFYKINERLEIDIDDLKSRITEKTKAVLFINYFGFPQPKKVTEFLKTLKNRGIVLIEDNVQSFFSELETVGDYIFNSFRKFLPIDGSVIISDHELKQEKDKKTFNSYYFKKTLGQFLRYLYIRFGIDTSRYFLKLFSKAEDNYLLGDVYGFNPINKFLISKMNIPLICSMRKGNYLYFIEKLKNVALYPFLNNNVVPLGFPILIDNRDAIRTTLREKNIFCPVHWKLSEEIDKKEFAESWYLSEKIITIPINERINDNEKEYITKVLETLL